MLALIVTVFQKVLKYQQQQFCLFTHTVTYIKRYKRTQITYKQGKRFHTTFCQGRR